MTKTSVCALDRHIAAADRVISDPRPSMSYSASLAQTL